MVFAFTVDLRGMVSLFYFYCLSIAHRQTTHLPIIAFLTRRNPLQTNHREEQLSTVGDSHKRKQTVVNAFPPPCRGILTKIPRGSFFRILQGTTAIA